MEQIYISSDSPKCTEICQHIPLLIKSQNSWTVFEDLRVFLYAYSVQLAEYVWQQKMFHEQLLWS